MSYPLETAKSQNLRIISCKGNYLIRMLEILNISGPAQMVAAIKSLIPGIV
jgi:hypothetical protein